MTGITPQEAAAFRCPIARTFNEGKSAACDGPACILWRWTPLAMGADHAAAISKEMKRIAEAEGKKGGPVYHQKAVAAVTADPAAHGLPVAPTHGYCGLGGKP